MTVRPLEKIRSDSRVQEIEDDRQHENGWWVYLKPGWCIFNQEEHTIHEDSLSKISDMLDCVFECDCADCQDELRFAHEPKY